MREAQGLLDQERIARSTRVIWVRKRLVLGCSVMAGIIAAVVSLLLPPTYEAVATCIPVSTQSGLGAISSFGLSMEDLGLPFGLSRNSTAVYPDVVKSRRTLNSLLHSNFATQTGDSVRLIDYVEKDGEGPKRIERALRSLRQAVSVNIDRRSGILSIRVESQDPVVAAGVANAASSLLQDFMIKTFSAQAGDNRRFIEARLVEAERSLGEAELKVRGFRERNLRIGNSPHLVLEQERLARALREQEEVYLTLRRQYEVAKIQENKDVPIISPLDTAEIPAIRSSPKRTLITCSGLLLGGLVGVGLILSRDQV